MDTVPRILFSLALAIAVLSLSALVFLQRATIRANIETIDLINEADRLALSVPLNAEIILEREDEDVTVWVNRVYPHYFDGACGPELEVMASR